MPMTRAEAVCALNNILTLVEELDELLTEKGRSDYATSVTDRMTSMRTFVLNEWRGNTITEKMDAAIRNTWEGLRKWDHDHMHTDELFGGLADVMMELQASAPAAESAQEPTGAERPVMKKQKGREATDETMPGGAMQLPEQTTAPAAPKGTTAPSASAPRQSKGDAKLPSTDDVQLLDRELVVRAREKVLGLVRGQVEEKKLSLVDTKIIAHADLAWLLNQTTSDRTRQLITAAFYAGKTAGVHALSQNLLE